MVTRCFLHGVFLLWVLSSTHCTDARALTHQGDAGQKVFMDEREAATFLNRKLLYNSWDFELLTPGNVERECYEEVCNYEEAREIYEDDKATLQFWEEYQQNQKPGGPTAHKFDVAGLVAGLIAALVLLILIGLLVAYFCKQSGKRSERPPGYRGQVTNVASQPAPRPSEELPLNTLEASAPGLPSYEEALRRSGHYDAPPPPYAGGSMREQQPS
ncbi:transmembrane gamma-carboxyglutamic acid protein 2 [Hypanus sabinus]|uniref:transmembrane gamma-carboxyglutamic acid protein 2 n=1 Tax=Hypanus sabinus TaxID=79690 RepID=UPI0028C4409A|nr:transmembrane gamma-carboxyglutamic acid protein 2 [Hypanus sabinus]XP_059809913.1 transmembrane gamma-carboxyglutamic acid protein 2 [Hypanus sabinus]XP_059809915.1 transmembrane gamma-carboxyglutamic acid protein 2 [Hypanus sabinus]